MTADGPRGKRWLLDEAAHAGPEHLDPVFVAGYERKQTFDPIPDLDLLRAHGLDETTTLVDLGAGTGTLALAAAPYCRRVIAVDVSPAMLEVLGHRAGKAGLSNVEAVLAGFLTYQHEGPPADMVYTRNALHHLPDFWKAVALARVADLLVAGGLLRLRDLVYDFPPQRADAVISGWLSRAPADPAEGYTAGDLEEHVRCEHSTFSWLLEPMLAAAGFEITSAELSGTFGAYTCFKA